MKNEKLKNIDAIMQASDIVTLLEDHKERAEKSYRENTKVDGTAKKGKALAVIGNNQSIVAADTVIRWIENATAQLKE